MSGMDENTGKSLTGLDEIKQSIRRILMTPKGSRCMNRDFGSLIFSLLDHPGNESNKIKLYASTIDAVLRWESRILPTRINIVANDNETGTFDIYLDAVATISIDEIQPVENLNLSLPLAYQS